MIPSKPGGEDIEVQANKQAWIEALYQYEGRDDKNHPMHGLYTGLMKKHRHTMSTDS
tara:strand:- start:1375 stop:1545 length:171 start_codon:yes stop_codon:yes gene_type:complete